MSAKEAISDGKDAYYATRVGALAVNVKLRRDQLLRERVGLVLTCVVSHNRDSLALGIGRAPELDGFHAPCR